MKVIIPKAIGERRLLRLIYDGRARTVEPHTLGLIDGKTDAMLCWQVSPPLRSGEQWQLFRLDKISGLRTLEEHFEIDPVRQPPLDVFCDIQATVSGQAHQAVDGSGNADAPESAETPQ